MKTELIQSLVGTCPHCGRINGLCASASGQWRDSQIENHHCACWWAGQQEGIYHLQHRRSLTDDEILTLSSPEELDDSEAYIIARAAARGARAAEMRAEAGREASARADALAAGGEAAYWQHVKDQHLYGGRHARRRAKLRKALGISNSPKL